MQTDCPVSESLQPPSSTFTVHSDLIGMGEAGLSQAPVTDVLNGWELRGQKQALLL